MILASAALVRSQAGADVGKTLTILQNIHIELFQFILLFIFNLYTVMIFQHSIFVKITIFLFAGLLLLTLHSTVYRTIYIFTLK